MSFTTLTVLATLSTISFFSSDFKLPATWEKDFTISVSHKGSMSTGTSEVMFTYDLCTYTMQPRNGGSVTKTYKLTEKDRLAIFKKLHDLKVDAIELKPTYATVNDGWSSSICLGLHCIEGGSSAELSDKDKNAFLDAYAYLEQFAIDKTKKH